MLIPYPKEMLDNPSCYTDGSDGNPFEPTSIATDEEKKAIAEFNKKWRRWHDEHGGGVVIEWDD